MNKARILLGIIKTIKNWPDYLFDYFNLINKRYITYSLRNGTKLITRAKTADRGIINEIYALKLYTPGDFEIGANDVVVEIGAHIGMFAIFASKKAKKVYSFEPMPENYELLRKNIQLNGITNITTFNVAVDKKIGQQEMFISPVNTGGHSFYSDSESLKIKVPTISLKDFVLKNKIDKIDFLKVDCEGAEYQILYNCPDEILNKIQKISMEYHTIKNENITELKVFLEKKGFDVRITTGDFPMLYAKKF